MEKLSDKFKDLHKEGKTHNAALIAASGIAAISGIKEALKMNNIRLAKVLIAEYERNLKFFLRGDD